MLKYGIPDLRTFYDADLRWLRHYGFLPLDIPSLVGGIGAMKIDALLAEGASRDRGRRRRRSRARLTVLGHEVESIEDRAAALAPFTVGYVVAAEAASQCRPAAGLPGRYRHGAGPGRLRRAQCAHRHEGRLRARRQPHSRHRRWSSRPGVIRGVASNGMLCSTRELGLGEDHDGIIELPDDAPVGAPFAEVLGLDDPRHRHQGDAEPRRLPRRARHRPRSRGRRASAG